MCVFGIFTNLSKDTELRYTRQILEALDQEGITYYLDEAVAGALGDPRVCGDRQIDVLIVLGGDGTMLAAARKYGGRACLLGLNIGRLGFLMDTEISDLRATIRAIAEERYHVEERLMLEAVILGADGREKQRAYALNEAVTSRGKVLRIVGVHLEVNGRPVDEWHCDGLIVSTPTGSTGYSLSAGGPVVYPTVEVLLVTPVCPHTLHSCNIVLSSEDEIDISIVPDTEEGMLTLDGQEYLPLAPGDHIRVRRAEKKVRFLRFTDKNFFLLLKEKLTEWVK